MKFIALGGLNEHGRNAFLLQSDHHKILLDCGLGEKGEYPDFSKVDVSSIDALFLSHSHLDHTGAINELIRRGFHGKIYLSKPTFDCMGINDITPTFLAFKEKRKLSNWLNVTSFRSGHCFGSYGYFIIMEGKRILYTGDYLENSVFSCDKIRDLYADLAIVDGAYSKNERSLETNRNDFLKLLASLKKNIILPLPKNGRNMEIISLLNQANIPYLVKDSSFFVEEENDYLKKNIPVNPTSNAKIFLIVDPQLERKESREIVNAYPDFNLIFTGTIDEGSYSSYLMKTRNNVYFQRINVHQTILEANALIENNRFANSLIFHNKETNEATSLSF